MIYGVTLFCEDVREEKPPLVSLIGIMPDNAIVPNFPGALPRIAFYTRVNFTPGLKTEKPIRVMIKVPGAPEGHESQEIGVITHEILAKTEETKTGLGGAYSYATAVNFVVPAAGNLTVFLDVDGEEIVTGMLNLSTPD